MLTDINKTCCFTGHRDIPYYLVNAIMQRLDAEIENHYQSRGVTAFISGGAIGFDMLAAEAVLAARKRHPDIKLIFAIPCADHSKKWKQSDITKFKMLTLCADEVTVLSERYYNGCMHARNRYMLDRSAYCIAYCTKNEGGTYYTVKTARAQNKIITEI